MTAKIAILVPIYRSHLDPLEQFSVDRSLAVLGAHPVFFIGPAGLDNTFYRARYPAVPHLEFQEPAFTSIGAYNRLLLSRDFYGRFAEYEYVLILQTDAVLLRDDLDYWCAQPFDYVGAPWPDGVELFVNAGRFDGDYGKRVRVHVGNGGLSLRRVAKSIALLEEFSEVVEVFCRTGSSEDLFFAFMGALSNDFVIPNEITASRFSMELRPSYYHRVNGGQLPMGGHAWWKWEPDFWRMKLGDFPAVA